MVGSDVVLGLALDVIRPPRAPVDADVVVLESVSVDTAAAATRAAGG